MRRIDNVTDQASQQTQIILDDGSILTLALRYNGATQRWVMDVTHTLLTILGINICNYPNILRQWRHLIPFGLACSTVSGQDPVNVEDFINGNATLYILTANEVTAVEAELMGGILQ